MCARRLERSIIAAQDLAKDAAAGIDLTIRDLFSSALEYGVGFSEAVKCFEDPLRSTRYVIVCAVWVDDSETIRIDLRGMKEISPLVEVPRRLHRDAILPNVELIAVEIQEVHKQIGQTRLWFGVLAQLLWQHLQHADYETNGSESAEAFSGVVVEAAHREKLLNDHDQDRHFGELLFPLPESLVCDNTRIVFKGNVDFDTGQAVHKFDDWDLGLSNDQQGTRFRNPLLTQIRTKFMLLTVSRHECLLAAMLEVL